jgi:hypothetical protein
MLDMRANGVAAILPFAPIIAFSAVMFGLVLIGGLLETRAMLGVRTLGLLAVCILLPVLFIFVLGLVLHWRALPRHFIPLVSLFNLLYAFGTAWWWRRRFGGMAVALTSLTIMAYSSLAVRYAPRHAKDDYKHAAELAAGELAGGGRVWWVADDRGALYYGIPVIDGRSPAPTQVPGAQVYLSYTTPSFLSAQSPPTLVLISKPDTYDRQNLITDYLSANKYHLVESFPAFTAWRQ